MQRAVAAVKARSATAKEKWQAKAKREELLAAGQLSEGERSALRGETPPPLLPDPGRSAVLLDERLPEARERVLADAARAKEHVFDLLGSGPKKVGDGTIDWHLDWKTGTRWPTGYYKEIPIKVVQGGPEDVKSPWELSRFYHASALGRAWRLTKDDAWPRELRAQVEDWVAKNPYAGSCNWINAMECGLRAIGWIVGAELAAPALDAGFALELRAQLLKHARFIVRNLEVYGTVTSNHYLSDGVGLLLISHALPESDEVRAWRAQAERLVFKEMEVQVRADGVDYENAVSYHRLVVELFLLAYLRLRRSGREVPRGFSERLEKMFEYTLHYQKPDGSVPWVADADDGRAFILGPLMPHDDHRYLLAIGAALFKRADFKRGAGELAEPLIWLLGEEGVKAWDALDASSAPPAGSMHFEPSRVAILREGDAHAFFDAGDVGVHGHGSHGHDDALSVELSLAGESFIRDPGVFVYSANPKKRFEARSIRAHNVIVVDGAEASGLREDYLWMTPDEQPARIDGFATSAGGDWVAGTHEGYKRLATPIVHSRRVVLAKPERAFVIHDRLEGSGEHVFRWQMLTPFLDARVVPLDQPSSVSALIDSVQARFANLGWPRDARMVGTFAVKGERTTLHVLVLATSAGEARVEPAVVSPSYGVERDARRLVVEWRTGAPLEVVAGFRAPPPA